jgi:broad specificity phosphatase PhoE
MSCVDRLYCSTERKAVDGAEILGSVLDLPFEGVQELGENDRSATGYLSSAEFEATADAFFARPNSSVRGWETAISAQSRIVNAVGQILAVDTGAGNIAIVSHGAVGTLYLCHLNRWRIDRSHDQPGSCGGNYFTFELTGNCVHGWVPIESAPPNNSLNPTPPPLRGSGAR